MSTLRDRLLERERRLLELRRVTRDLEARRVALENRRAEIAQTWAELLDVPSRPSAPRPADD